MPADAKRVALRAEKHLSSLISQVGAAFAAGFGIAALLGWVAGLPLLGSFGASWKPMPPSTALLFALYGSAAFFTARTPLGRTAYRIGMGIGTAVAVLALLLFILSWTGIYLEAEYLGFTIAGTVGGARVGHMSPVTALCFVLAGLSLVATLASSRDRHGLAMAAFWLASFVIVVAIVFLLAYLFGAPLLYGGEFIPPALTTSLAFTALGTALTAFAGPRAWAPEQEIEAATLRASRSYILVFAFLAAGLIAVGYVFFHQHEKRYIAHVKHQLSAIARLKAGELASWRAERLADARALADSSAFYRLVRRALDDPRDAQARDQLQGWLREIQEADRYDKVVLLDAQGIAQISIPDKPSLAGTPAHAREALRSGRITFMDIHRDVSGEAVRLSVLAPIADAKNRGHPLGVVVLEIDPAKYLYPSIERWPVPSRSGEFLLVRRDGNDALVLNELRLRKNAALPLRFPLARTELPAVQAALGHNGIVEGVNSHGVPVIAAARAVPDSPWALVASMDAAEILEPMRQDMWLAAVLVGTLLLAAGAATGLIWRHQRVRHYKERLRSAEALAHQKDLYDMLSQTNQAIVRITRREELFPAVCRIAVEHGHFRFAWIGMIDKHDRQLKPAAEYGEDGGYVEQIHVSVDASDPAAGHGPVGQALDAGKRAVSNDFLNDPNTAPWHEAAQRAGVRASAAFPIRERGIVVGTMVLSAGEPGFFTDDMLPTLDEMALDLSFALDNFAHQAEIARAVEALRASELSYRQLFAANPHPMWVYDLETLRFLAVNDAAVAHYGYSRDEFQAMTIADIRPAEDILRLLENVAHVEEGRIDEAGIWRHRKKDGTLIDVEITSHVFDFGGRRSEVVLAHDVTERKRAEQSLQAAEQQFRGLVEQSIAGIYIIQKDKLVYVNPRLAEILGYDSAELIGRDVLSVVAETDRAKVVARTRHWLESDERSFDYDFTALRRDGSMIDVGVHGARATHNGRRAIIGMIQDISEKKRSEVQIQRYLTQLQTAFMNTVEVAMTLSEMRDPYTAGHERRVGEIAVAIGSELGFDEYRLEGLRVAGYLHDIGKITIPAEILSKPGKLTPIELQLIKGHSQASYDVLKDMKFPWPVAAVALQHHERMDGSGYPQGLKGEAILLEARITAVADVIEAMASHRPYRPGLGIDKALAEIERGRGRAYDPVVADACLKLFREKGYAIPV